MITVRNITKQGREVIFKDADGYIHQWLEAHASISVPESFITDTINELALRKILKLRKN